MLSVAFVSEVLEQVRLEALKDRLIRLVEKRFRGELAWCGECKACN
jgi:Fe-S cluster assembly protein SufD